jgi:DNA invertase Pin-like site-specific DNA recombinase
LRRLLNQLAPGDVLMVTRLDRLARLTRDLLNTLAAITDRKAGFRSLGDAWTDTTTSHGRLILTVLGGLAEFEHEPIRAASYIRANYLPISQPAVSSAGRPGEG